MDDLVGNIHSTIDGNSLNAWIAAVVIIAVTAVVSAIFTRVIRRLMQVDGLPLPESSILVNVARVIVWTIGVSIMLSACFDVDVNALITALGVGGVALSLGMQDTIKNFIGGLQVTLMGIVHPGDHIEFGGVEGFVEDVSWRQTVVRDFEGKTHLIPNSLINSTTVTKINPTKLVSSTVVLNTDGRDIDEVLHQMEQLAKRGVEKVAELERDPWLLVTQIGEYGIWAKMRFVLAKPENMREARDAALRAVAPYTRNNADAVLLDDGDDD